MNINISCKSISKKKCSIESITYEYNLVPVSIMDFITETVKIMISNYLQRKENSELLRVLTNDDIMDKSTHGKISFDRIYNDNEIDESAAIDNAIQCFIDGIFLIFVDGTQFENIDDNPHLHENSEVTFIKMTMLSGRMW